MKVQRKDRSGNLRNEPFEMEDWVYERYNSRTKGKHNLVIVDDKPKLKRRKLPK